MLLFKNETLVSEAMMRKQILIYQDTGTNDIRNLKKSLEQYFQPQEIAIKTTNADEIIKKNILDENILAFFMPGGRATPYLEKLKKLGNEKIASYVQNGGIYFGICAGAYYASRKVFFETDVKELCIIQECGLNLIDADAIGTLYKELNISPYTRDFQSIAPVKVRWLADEETHIACYHGGPYFKPLSASPLQVLAEYELNGKKLPAVVIQQHGQGIAVASGLHIEDSAQSLREVLLRLNKKDEYTKQVLQKLEAGEASRATLFNKLMSKLAPTR